MPPRLLAARSMPALRDPLYALLRLLPLLRDEAVSLVDAEGPREEPASRLPTAPVDALGPRWPADLSLTPAPPPARS
jgi:hypothetical protein